MARLTCLGHSDLCYTDGRVWGDENLSCVLVTAAPFLAFFHHNRKKNDSHPRVCTVNLLATSLS